MLNVELIMIIAQICMSSGNSPEAVRESIKCNEQIILCTESTYHKQFIKNQVAAFNSCHIQYELNK